MRYLLCREYHISGHTGGGAPPPITLKKLYLWVHLHNESRVCFAQYNYYPHKYENDSTSKTKVRFYVSCINYAINIPTV